MKKPQQFLLENDFFKIAPKVTKKLGNFCEKNATKSFQKSANLVTLDSATKAGMGNNLEPIVRNRCLKQILD